MRKVVEPSAAALAATRRDEDTLAKLADALARMAKLGPRDKAWHGAVLDFHHFVLSASGNELLAAMWPPVQVTLQWSLNLAMAELKLRLAGDPVADHAKVFEKIAHKAPREH